MQTERYGTVNVFVRKQADLPPCIAIYFKNPYEPPMNSNRRTTILRPMPSVTDNKGFLMAYVLAHLVEWDEGGGNDNTQ